MSKFQDFPGQPSETELVSIIASRICHDLISPLGAIGNGVELLNLNGTAGNNPELSLIAASVEQAQARVRFFRIAFGDFSAEQLMKPAEARSILSGLFREARLSVTWDLEAPRPRQEVKLIFLLIQCLETTLPWSGTVVIRSEGEGWAIDAQAARLQVNRDLWACVSASGEPCITSPQVVQFALAGRQSAALPGTLDVWFGDSDIHIRYLPH
ncbi:histidine phosphotransferase [Rhodobacteraceae bacterium 2376]|uniref:Histidine phosphotransferase n=1 Tax=Rhabdonatronobacter sediminivivens TaxID=2743469 RepID=A0A7Z0KZJ6_9RHOB|nr:histidine phosphotransferase family protein [Rhabdonatronobacter sediminivivens]NYS24503.1 histidine phosphotransferase [Rhabdonatronobacter sediminivivens]